MCTSELTMALKNAVHIKEGKDLQFKVRLGLGLHYKSHKSQYGSQGRAWEVSWLMKLSGVRANNLEPDDLTTTYTPLRLRE